MVSLGAFTQVEHPWEAYLNEVMTAEDVESETWERTYELLCELEQHPLDINRVSREQLEQLPFLSAQQIEELMEYLDRYGPIKSLGELRMIRSLDDSVRRLLSCLVYVDEAEVLPADEHRLRGTFIGMDRVMRLERYDPEEDGVACVMLADGERDKFYEGVDATDGSLTTNVGNYGVLYRIEVSTRRKTKFFLSPMGGAFAGALRVEAGASGTRLANAPDGRMYFGQDSVHPPFAKDGTTMLLPSVELLALGEYRAKPPAFFEFSPPGASNLPVLLILAPEDLKTEEGKGKS